MLRKLAFLKKPQLSLQKSRSFRCKKAAAFAAKKPQLSLQKSRSFRCGFGKKQSSTPLSLQHDNSAECG